MRIIIHELNNPTFFSPSLIFIYFCSISLKLLQKNTSWPVAIIVTGHINYSQLRPKKTLKRCRSIKISWLNQGYHDKFVQLKSLKISYRNGLEILRIYSLGIDMTKIEEIQKRITTTPSREDVKTCLREAISLARGQDALLSIHYLALSIFGLLKIKRSD